MSLAEFALALLMIGVGIPAVLSSLYLLAATLLSARPARPKSPQRTLRFDVIVPAHNEAGGIARTLENLRGLDWRADGYRLIVVADNCTDSTAAVAAANGAVVLERHDEDLRGKGYALEFAFERSRNDGWADAVVVVDADSETSPNFLESIAARIENGAHAVQVHYGVLNLHAAWRTRLIAIAMGAFHRVRSRARERLHLSCGIRGNGWCVTHALLQTVPYQSFSLTEDIEYGIEIGMNGHRVHYCDEAHVYGEMVTNSHSAGKQRQRWEQGRFEIIREFTLPLLRTALVRPSRVCLDLALDLMVLPLSYVTLNIAALAACSAVAALAYPHMTGGLWIAAGCAVCLVLYVLRGWRLSGVGWRGLLDLLWAPAFVAWKVLLALSGNRATGWLRTDRERR
jgi:cellulose synthase/poly-beta-1,6-N-acetylglucosamine synthase-like glycosyltransferase